MMVRQNPAFLVTTYRVSEELSWLQEEEQQEAVSKKPDDDGAPQIEEKPAKVSSPWRMRWLVGVNCTRTMAKLLIS